MYPSSRFLLSCFRVFVILLATPALRADTHQVGPHNFTLPQGFTIERVAGSPMVDRPVSADFDEQGRLYVTDSSGSNDKVEKQLANPNHRVVRLEDTDGDGRYDKQTVFADKMMFLQGAMWYDGSLYVAAPPSIWKLTDTNGDGVADRREEWFKGHTLTGCANDLHGPYLGPDGWFYWTKGAFARQVHERKGKEPFVTRAAHIFRARPDGTGMEPVMTGGMDNPVEVVINSAGERFFTSTFLVHPGGGQRDGLVHAIYGGVYGKEHDVLNGHPRTGDTMPIMVHYGPAAPSGLCWLESGAWGTDYIFDYFVTLFNMRKVTRHNLSKSGGTYSATSEDFLLSDNTDFHPTDVLADADGSLLVIDTGGWYKLCCPTSQLAKPDVLGAIYRVRRRSAEKVEDPRGLRLSWREMPDDAMLKLLGDTRPAVRKRAIEELPNRTKHSAAILGALVKLLDDDSSSGPSAIWALARFDNAEARAAVRELFDHPSRQIRLSALHLVSQRRDRVAMTKLLWVLFQSEDLRERRLAAEALGRIGDERVVPKLLEAAATAEDRSLEHAIIYALIEIAAPRITAAGIESRNPRTQATALIALDQMPNGRLNTRHVISLITSTSPELKSAARWIIDRHPEWGATLAEMFRAKLHGGAIQDGQDRTTLQSQLGRFAGDAAIQALLAEVAGDAAMPLTNRELAIRAMQQARLKRLPTPWGAVWTKILTKADDTTVGAVVAAAHAQANTPGAPPEFSDALLSLSRDKNRSTELRLEALSAGLNQRELNSNDFDLAMTALVPDQSLNHRSAAVEILTRGKLTSGQLIKICEQLSQISPLEAPRLLTAFEDSTDRRVGRRLAEELKRVGPTLGLRSEVVQPILTRFGSELEPLAKDVYATLEVKTADQRKKLEELIQQTQNGDVRRGQALFNNAKTSCSACHAIGYLGGTIGPDLTRIGQIRTHRDLLEAIIFPSASFVRSYEPVVIRTHEGRTLAGVVRRETTSELTLALGAKEEARVAHEDIEVIQPGTVSIMPAGLDTQLTPQELADLVAFLKACR